MQSKEILALGLGLESPWELVDQQLDTQAEPHKLYLRVSAPRGSRFPCPGCGEPCKAHNFDPIRTALAPIEYQFESIIQRWHASLLQRPLEGLNSIFQAARARARGYRNRRTLITTIYLLTAPSATSQNSFSASKRP